MTHPPGEPFAETMAEHLADVLIVDGPHAGEIWTYDAGHGGYVRASARGRMTDETICVNIAALITHTGCEVVRPLPTREES